MGDEVKVLVVDDSEIVCAVTRTVLERDGFEVRAAQSLHDFDVILEGWTPNIVLTDVNMPGATGPELCRRIKVRIDTDSIPVVFFSELSDAELEEVARASGADGFLSKAHGLEQLSRKLRSMCEEIVF